MKHRAKVVLVRIIKFSLNAQICIKLHLNDNIIYFATQKYCCHTQILILNFFFIFLTAQQDEGEESAGSESGLTPPDRHQDFSLSGVRDLRKMVHKAVMKDGNVLIYSGVFNFLTNSNLLPHLHCNLD